MATKRSTKAPGKAENPKEEIRLRAYELYEARGRKDDHALDDWLRAEAEITKKEIAKKKPRSAVA